eukprot:TRINITY_DN13822_c0_g1_i2.p1 TRINITY_DN13822_c0_g1~~TRINITY_DN13822_c0_g1_i2.p1  ORF type:complete len:350 (+),score=36.30 TRINITY_DN13822_c0_g1_i2:90-1139(+)
MGAQCCPSWRARPVSLQAAEPHEASKVWVDVDSPHCLKLEVYAVGDFEDPTAADGTKISNSGNGGAKTPGVVIASGGLTAVCPPASTDGTSSMRDHADGEPASNSTYTKRRNKAASRSCGASNSRCGEAGVLHSSAAVASDVTSPLRAWQDWRMLLDAEDMVAVSETEATLPDMEITYSKEGNHIISVHASFEDASAPTIAPSDEGAVTEEWLTVQCSKGFPLILNEGEWVKSKERITFHEWVEYALWTQRDVFEEWTEVELRSGTPQGQLVNYQVQVLASQKDLFTSIFLPVWEEMRGAYRLPRNHGGTSAPLLKWGVEPKFKRCQTTNDSTSSARSVTHSSQACSAR